MKKFFLATAAVLALTTAASAGEMLGVAGEVEYSVENQAAALKVGPDFAFGDFAVLARVKGSVDSSSLDFTGADVEANYAIGQAVYLFGKIEADADFAYQDTKLGLRFAF